MYGQMGKLFSAGWVVVATVVASCIPDVVADRFVGEVGGGGIGASAGGGGGDGGVGGDGGTCGETELCATPVDDNCNTLVNDDEEDNLARCVCSPVDFATPCFKLVANQQFGDADDQDLHDVIVDGAGDVIVSGYFRRNMFFGTTTLMEGSPDGVHELFVAKLRGSDLVEVWARQYGGMYAGPDFGSFDGENRIAVSADHIAIGGSFEDTVSFNGTDVHSASGADGFVLLLDTAGEPVWPDAFVISGLDTDRVRDLAFVDDGLIVVGYYEDDTNLPGCTLPDALDNGDEVFAAKLSLTTGQAMWCKAWRSTHPDPGNGVLESDGTEDQAHAIVVHDGRVFIAGGFSGTMDFGVATVVARSEDQGSIIRAYRDMFIVEIDPADGDELALATYGESLIADPDDQWFLDLAVAGDKLFAVGLMDSAAQLGGAPLSHAGDADLVVAAFDLDLAPLWSEGFGGMRDDGEDTLRIAVDERGRVFVAGTSGSDAVRFFDDPETGALTDPGGDSDRAAYVIQLDAETGEIGFARMFGREFDDKMMGLAVSGNALFLGSSSTSAMQWGKDLPELTAPPQFPGCTATPDTCYDVHVAKLLIDDTAE